MGEGLSEHQRNSKLPSSGDYGPFRNLKLGAVRRGLNQHATTNAGILHCVQDDDVERATTKQATTKHATTNTGILHCVQDDDVERATTKQAPTKQATTMRGSFTAFRMTT
jgi:hypothetical protein